MQDCDWIEFKFNVAHASHMGGVRERQIQTTQSVLSSLLLDDGTQLDNEAPRTLNFLRIGKFKMTDPR